MLQVWRAGFDILNVLLNVRHVRHSLISNGWDYVIMDASPARDYSVASRFASEAK